MIVPQQDSREAIRFRGCSLLALALSPRQPLDKWCAKFAAWNEQSPQFFRGKPVVLDVSGIELNEADLCDLIGHLTNQGVRLIGVEGVPNEAWLSPGMPPALSGGAPVDLPDASGAREKIEHQSMLIHEPVRSGQSVVCPNGDVTIVASVSSGAEVIAGGSIHIYGALRGRALAGAKGRQDARIFCSNLQAEMVAINGLYRTADDIADDLRGKQVQVQLTGGSLNIAVLI